MNVPPSGPVLCPHFGECGGCASQDVPYAEQLARKQQRLQELFRDFWSGEIPIAPSPSVWHYRNKMDFNFARKRYDEPPPPGTKRDTVVGFNRKGKWYWPLDIEDCLIAPERAGELLMVVRAWAKREGLEAYDDRTKEGSLRVLLLREGRRTGQHMVMLITRPGVIPAESFADAVRSVYPQASVQHGEYTGEAQGKFADTWRVIRGPDAISEELRIPDSISARAITFRISPFSFFQTNTLAAEVLYGNIRAWVRETSPEVLYDLYGGTGSIAFACAYLVKVVRSIENVTEAALDGEANARANAIENVFFTAADVRAYLLNVANDGGMEPRAAAVVDPPRAGMQPKALKRLIACAPKDLLYVSCKPEMLAQEMPELLKRYVLTSFDAVDMFPHTPHVEALAMFRRK